MRTSVRILVASFSVALSSCLAQAAPFAYIPAGVDDLVTVIDTASNTVVATAHGVGQGTFGVAVHPDGKRVYFTNNYVYADAVSVFDTTTYSRVATIRVGSYPVAIAVNAAGTRAYVANGNSDSISVIDTTTNAVVGTYPACRGPRGLAMNSAGTRIYVGCSAPGGKALSLAAVDADSGALIGSVPVGEFALSTRAIGIAVSPSGARVYVPSSGSNTLAVIDAVNNTVVATIAVGLTPTGAAVNLPGTRVYVTNFLSNTVSVVDTATNAVIDTVAVGFYPTGIAINPAGTHVYAVNSSGGSVSVIDEATHAVVATVPIARDSYPMAVGQFIGGQAPPPVPPSLPPVPGPAQQVAAGTSHTCAVVAGGGVKCWGDNRYGQLGNGGYASSARPVDVVGLSFPAASIAVGANDTCAVSAAGAVRCWGGNYSGKPADVAGLSSGVAAVAIGAGHACALATGGEVRCWGNNDKGQLGDGTSSSRGEARPVSGLSGAVGIAAGPQISAAVTADGRVKSWGVVRWDMQCYGDPLRGGYCLFNPVISKIPADAPSLPGGITAVSISPSSNKACALAPGGRVLCWYVDMPSSPEGVDGLSAGVAAISIGVVDACALVPGGVALCWTPSDSSRPPAPIPGLPQGLVGIAAGGYHKCALTAAGEVMCWGTNDHGQLGDGTVVDRPAPVTVIGTAANYQGLFWNSPGGSESGWGINFAHQGDTIFATWFTYDAAGRGLWLTMTADKTGEGVYSGTLYQTRGPAFNTVPFNPGGVSATAVGTGTVTFTDASNGRFAYTVNGISQTKSITRQVFGTVPTCTFGAQPNLALATNYQDLWWSAPAGAESGWGVNFTHQGDTIFATWFTYDLDGTPMWLSATVDRTVPGAYTGAIYRTTGPAFNAVPFNPANVVATPVGTLTLTFANGNSATFAYTVSGVSQSKSIVRQVFRMPGTVCH